VVGLPPKSKRHLVRDALDAEVLSFSSVMDGKASSVRNAVTDGHGPGHPLEPHLERVS